MVESKLLFTKKHTNTKIIIISNIWLNIVFYLQKTHLKTHSYNFFPNKYQLITYLWRVFKNITYLTKIFNSKFRFKFGNRYFLQRMDIILNLRGNKMIIHYNLLCIETHPILYYKFPYKYSPLGQQGELLSWEPNITIS